MSVKSAKDIISDKETKVAPLSIIALESATELGNNINDHLIRWNKRDEGSPETFLVEADCPRFSSGDGKGLIKASVRGDDLFIIVDVGNYSCSYKMFGRENAMSPDDHYQDLKRIIQAVSGKSYRINIIMPILYGGRQHGRNFRESLDCACALQELRNMGVSNIITFDAHDPRVQNAVPLMGFDNVMPYYQVLKAWFKFVPDLKPDANNLMIVSPDEGAMDRNMFYASTLGVDLGIFYKRRDYSHVIDGRNPIVAHEYLGNSVEGKDVFIADDIIASGESVLDVAKELKKRKARRIFAYATYGTFTSGLSKFDKAYEDGLISGILSTNLTYRTAALKSREWYCEVDISKYIAYFIAALNHDVSVNLILDPRDKINRLLQKKGFI